MASVKRLILGMVAGGALLAPVSAQAWIGDDATDFLGRVAKTAYSTVVDTASQGWTKPAKPTAGQPAVAQPAASLPAVPTLAAATPVLPAAVPGADAAAVPAAGIAAAPGDFTVRAVSLADFDMPALPSVAVAELPAPSVEKPLRRLFCVEYARARSGLAVFGDAKFWWAKAKNLYARASLPMENAVMVFSGSRRLKHGHVAVVTDIVSNREIRVDQANWQNHGEIDHATPVLDVSADNDWTQVRVWDMASNGFGSHVYAVSGFIAKELSRRASND